MFNSLLAKLGIFKDEKNRKVCTKKFSSKKKVLIDVKNVWKIYSMGEVEVPALSGLSLRIKQGDFAVVMGPSGSGKSTAMNMIGCLDTPTKGEIYLDGKNIACLSETELAKIRGKKIGFVFQKFNLIQSLSAVENVALSNVFQNVPRDERIGSAEKLLEIVGLKGRMYHRPGEMSGGEQQRVAIARALANDPEIILADEPTGNLDSATGKKIMQLLIDLHQKQKKTLIIVTHDHRFENIVKDEKLFYLKDGRIENEK